MSSKEIKLLTTQTMPVAMEIIAKAFCRREPLFGALKLDEDAFVVWATRIAENILHEEFSYIVCDANGKVIGAALRGKVSTLNWYGPTWPVLKPVGDVLKQLKTPAYIKETDPEKVLFMYMAGSVPPEDGGQRGVYEALMRHALVVAKERGMHYAMSDLTSPITQHICLDKLGFKSESEVVYSESGVSEYKNVAGKAVLAVLDLNNYQMQ